MWADKTQARRHWKDAPTDDTTLDELLTVAFQEVVRYAPPIPDRTFTADLVNGSPLIVADTETAGITDSDIGRDIDGVGIPAAAKVMYVTPLAITSTLANTATGTAVTVTVSGVPLAYTLATIYQAREVHTAAIRGESDVIGIGDYAIRARPLTAAVRQLLRPRRVSFKTG